MSLYALETSSGTLTDEARCSDSSSPTLGYYEAAYPLPLSPVDSSYAFPSPVSPASSSPGRLSNTSTSSAAAVYI